MKLIVGLGNPGSEYEFTRHNIGFRAVDEIAKKFDFPEFSANKKIDGFATKGKIQKAVSVLLKPQTFMNLSGASVQAALNFYKIESNNLIVIHDDKDIPIGETRVQRDRGSAGHNGVKSIIESLGGKDFTRIRIGIGPKDGKIYSTPDFVLQKFSKEEENELVPILRRVTEEIIEAVK